MEGALGGDLRGIASHLIAHVPVKEVEVVESSSTALHCGFSGRLPARERRGLKA